MSDEREIEELRADAARYQFIRDSNVQSHSLSMSGEAGYRFRGGWPDFRGFGFDDAVDKAIAEVEKSKAEDF